MSKQIFISGIDTDCGKTYITGLLAKNIMSQGLKCITSKFVQTGCTGISEDILEHRKTMQSGLFPEDRDGTTCPFVYTFPASPHLSAKIDNRPFAIEKVRQSIIRLKSNYDVVLTEGAGGLTVPLTPGYLTSDYLRDSGIPVILVASSRLGSINHSILSIEFCKSNNINLIAVVFNLFPDDDLAMAKESYLFISNYLKEKHPLVKLMNNNDISNRNLATQLFG